MPPSSWAPPETAPASTPPAGAGWAPTAPPSGPAQPSWGSGPPGAPQPGYPPPGFPPPAPTANRPSKKPLIIVLSIFGVLVALAIAGIAAVALLTTAERDDSGVIVDQGSLDVFELQVGDCFMDEAETPTSPDDTTQVESVEAIPCEQSHNAEVFANIDLPDGDFPGDAPVTDMAETRCFDEFEPYVGMAYESSEYNFGWFVPTGESWSNGDRTINCVLYLNDGGASTGSARGSGR